MSATIMERLFWNTTRRNQGQIVEISEPQIAGTAQGEAGPARGLQLRLDRSDQSWEVSDKRLGPIMWGSSFATVPTVVEAMKVRQQKRS